jgi:cell division protein FtsL
MKQVVFFVLASAVFVTAVEVVFARHQARKLFVEIQVLEKTRDDLNEEWGRLQLEQSTWATNARIETLARTRLDMKTPAMESLVVIEK